jgi:hypothetical protein
MHKERYITNLENGRDLNSLFKKLGPNSQSTSSTKEKILEMITTDLTVKSLEYKKS